MEQYTNLIAACKILNDASFEEYRAALAFTPAWEILAHASLYLSRQANTAMRGEDK